VLLLRLGIAAAAAGGVEEEEEEECTTTIARYLHSVETYGWLLSAL
jgi:tellurite resistance protein